MNIENLDKLIAALEAAPDEKFDIRRVFTDKRGEQSFDNRKCNTAACLVGFCILAAGKKTGDRGSAQNWLDIGQEDSFQLFCPDGHYGNPEYYPRSRAIATLKRLRKTGKVDWGRTPKAKRSA